MKVYVKSRNRWEDYEWLPTRPQPKEPYEAAPGEQAHTLPLPDKRFAVVLPGLPSGRTDFCQRRIEDRLVVEGVSKPQADHLLHLYRQDTAPIAAMVEARLFDREDNTQALSPQLLEDVADLLLHGVPTPAAADTPATLPAATGLPRTEIILLILRILLLLGTFCLYYCATGE